MLASDLDTVLCDICNISIRLASLDVPSFNMALRIFRAQSSLSAAQAALSSILIELSNVSPSSVSDP